MLDLRGRLPTNGQYGMRMLDSVRYLVIHHTGVDTDSDPASIAEYHLALGWPGIGYHFVIRYNGEIAQANDLSLGSYNVAGRNAECVGIVLTGNFTHHQPTPLQLGAARNLCRVLMPVLDPDEDGSVLVVGHRDIALRGYETSCPGATWPEWRYVFQEWKGWRDD